MCRLFPRIVPRQLKAGEHCYEPKQTFDLKKGQVLTFGNVFLVYSIIEITVMLLHSRYYTCRDKYNTKR